MEKFEVLTNSAWFNLLLIICLVVIIILLVINIISIRNLKRSYKGLIKLLGKGDNFNEIFDRYTNEVDNVSRETIKLKNKTENLEKNMEKCVQKVGITRYNAYRKPGNDLCFAIALLDFEDNGIVINGIYTRDNTTTTYAKPIEHGKSKYTLVKEEEEAIEIAKHNAYKC